MARVAMPSRCAAWSRDPRLRCLPDEPETARMTVHQAIALPRRLRHCRDVLRRARRRQGDAARCGRSDPRSRAGPRRTIYWPDMLGSAAARLCRAGRGDPARQSVGGAACGLVSALALYRALLFIHELTHIHATALPGFRLGWNLLVGIPMLTPSFMYEGVHTLHHARTRYGTAEDPEYLPLALMKPWSLPLFVMVGAAAADRPADPFGRAGAARRAGPAAAPAGVGARSRRCRSTPSSAAARPRASSARQVFWQEAGRFALGAVLGRLRGR